MINLFKKRILSQQDFANQVMAGQIESVNDDGTFNVTVKGRPYPIPNVPPLSDITNQAGDYVTVGYQDGAYANRAVIFGQSGYKVASEPVEYTIGGDLGLFALSLIGSDRNVYTFDYATSTLTKLTDFTGIEALCVAWGENKEKIYFIKVEGGVYSLCRINADGSGFLVLNADIQGMASEAFSIQLFPDYQKILITTSSSNYYVYGIDGSYINYIGHHLYFYVDENTQPTIIDNGANSFFLPMTAISSDGLYLLIAGSDESDSFATMNLYRVEIGQEGYEKIYEIGAYSDIEVLGLAYYPDRSGIVISIMDTNIDPTYAQIYVLSPDGASIQQVSDFNAITNDIGWAFYPRLTEDLEYIVFIGYSSGGIWDLYSLEIISGITINLTNFSTVQDNWCYIDSSFNPKIGRIPLYFCEYSAPNETYIYDAVEYQLEELPDDGSHEITFTPTIVDEQGGSIGAAESFIAPSGFGNREVELNSVIGTNVNNDDETSKTIYRFADFGNGKVLMKSRNFSDVLSSGYTLPTIRSFAQPDTFLISTLTGSKPYDVIMAFSAQDLKNTDELNVSLDYNLLFNPIDIDATISAVTMRIIVIGSKDPVKTTEGDFSGYITDAETPVFDWQPDVYLATRFSELIGTRAGNRYEMACSYGLSANPWAEAITGTYALNFHIPREPVFAGCGRGAYQYHGYWIYFGWEASITTPSGTSQQLIEKLIPLRIGLDF